MRIKLFESFISENESRYPELQKIAKDLAFKFLEEINNSTKDVESDMPYKEQYVLEEVIKILNENV